MAEQLREQQWSRAALPFGSGKARTEGTQDAFENGVVVSGPGREWEEPIARRLGRPCLADRTVAQMAQDAAPRFGQRSGQAFQKPGFGVDSRQLYPPGPLYSCRKPVFRDKTAL
jgi:hypothetical protein